MIILLLLLFLLLLLVLTLQPIVGFGLLHYFMTSLSHLPKFCVITKC
jgi:hypothetical protein